MKDAQKPDHKSLIALISRLKEGRFVVPDFQRDFEWKPWDIRDLMRSVFLDYYIGSLLLWKGKPENFKALACEPIYGFQNGDESREHIVLDGQQRLTALYYAFVAPDEPAPNRANRYLYFIDVERFMAGADDEAFEYNWTQSGVKLLNNATAQYERHMFPLSVVGQGGWALPTWMQGYQAHWQEKASQASEAGDVEAEETAERFADDAAAFGEHVKGITEEYQIAYIELDKDLELDKVCDIFTQVNSKGIRLDVFDLINALVRPKGLQLKHMWREARPQLDFVETDRMNVYILQVMSILRQSYCSPKYLYYLLPGQQRPRRDPDGTLHQEVLVPDTAVFTELWDEAVAALKRAIEMLRHPHEFGVNSSAYLPYVSILPAFSALERKAATLPANRQLDAQRKIRHWYWASVFLNRYSGSVESTASRDYLDVTSWLDDDEREPALIGEFKSRFRSIELRNEVRSGTSVYNGIFNLLVIRGARDWMTGNVPQHGDLDDHHIVPKDWGKQQGLGNQIDTILNRTPLTAESNRHVINDRLPNEYLPELIEENDEATVRATLESHLIPREAFDILCRNPFTPEDFDAFLTARQKEVLDAIEELLVKERLDLKPELRELDAEVEKIELSLRRLVLEALGNDAARVPEHIRVKVQERLDNAARKNPALDSEHYKQLAGQLEYFDLRELQDTISNKALWPEFEPRFKTKEGLATRFAQLAELRNGIRHSRTVDDVTRKDGEAGLIWFEQLLV